MMGKGYFFRKNEKLALELLVKTFYAFDLSSEDLILIKEDLKKFAHLPKDYQRQVDEVIEFYKKNSDTVDELIASHLINWRFDRLGKIEKSALRVGVTYILYLKNLYSQDRYENQLRYIISSLLEILECYGGNKDSIRFVNGVLGRIFREQTNQPQTTLSV